MKNYTKLREPNRKAAMSIALYLKRNKAITQAEFKNRWCQSRGWRSPAFHNGSAGSYFALSQNYENTMAYMFDHGIMTREEINGMVFFIATQKTVKSKPENLFVEEVEILQSDLQKAIIFQQAAKGLLDPVTEGMAIAKVLGLKGDVAKEFGLKYPIALSNYNQDWDQNLLGEDCTKYAIVNMVSFPKEYNISTKYVRIDDVTW